MKCFVVIIAMALAGASFALDNQGWLVKARECAEAGKTHDSDETKEDGVYCIALVAIRNVE